MQEEAEAHKRLQAATWGDRMPCGWTLSTCSSEIRNKAVSEGDWENDITSINDTSNHSFSGDGRYDKALLGRSIMS